MAEHPSVVQRAGGTTGGGAFAIILVWIVSLYEIQVPADVGIAFGTAFSLIGNVLVKRFG